MWFQLNPGESMPAKKIKNQAETVLRNGSV